MIAALILLYSCQVLAKHFHSHSAHTSYYAAPKPSKIYYLPTHAVNTQPYSPPSPPSYNSPSPPSYNPTKAYSKATYPTATYSPSTYPPKAYTEPVYPPYAYPSEGYQQPAYQTETYPAYASPSSYVAAEYTEKYTHDHYAGGDMNYAFEYSVNDNKGNVHSRNEKRQGSLTVGQYSVNLPDGRKQIVNYQADQAGYQADVKYE